MSEWTKAIQSLRAYIGCKHEWESVGFFSGPTYSAHDSGMIWACEKCGAKEYRIYRKIVDGPSSIDTHTEGEGRE